MSDTPKRNIRNTGGDSSTPITHNREYYLENRERLVKYQQEKRKRPEDKERVSEYKRQYHIKNRERLLEKSHEWYVNNKEKANDYRRKWATDNRNKVRGYQKKFRLSVRIEAFSHYGGEKCACCGETQFEFLTIDHMEGNGNKHRKNINIRGGHNFYSWLRQNNWPPGYQVLCFNCNQAKGFFGRCPHMPL